jgi:aminoglycoside phosphotransferase (APT) family kinase protein
MAEEYSRVSGCDVGDIDFYVVLACFKTAVIFEEISARRRANDGPSDDADDALARADAFFARAADIASRSSIPALRRPLRSTTHHPETSA